LVIFNHEKAFRDLGSGFVVVQCWIGARHKLDKITQFDIKQINHFIPNRLKFFDEMNFNMYPM